MPPKAKGKVPYPQFDYPGSKISPFTGKPYTAAEKQKVHQNTLARDKKKREEQARLKQQQAAGQQKRQQEQDEYRKVAAYYKKNGHLATEFKNETRKRFDDVDDKDTSELGKRVALGKMTKEEALRLLRQGYAVNDENKKRVGLDVAAELDPQMNAIERRRGINKSAYDRELEADRAAYQRMVAQQQERTTRTVGDIKGIYEAIMAKLGASSAPGSDDAAARIQQNYEALQQKIAQANQQAQSATAAEVAGAQGGTTQGQIRGQEDTNAYAAIAGIQNQGIQGTLATQRQGLEGITAAMRYGIGMESGQEQTRTIRDAAQEQSDLLFALEQRAAQLRGEYSDEDTELQGQYADLDESRYPRLYEGRRSLEDAQMQAAQEAEDREYERQMAERALGIKEFQAETGRYAVDQRTAIANAQLAQEAKIAANKHNLEVKRLKIEQAKSSDPLERSLLQAKIDKEQALATKALADAQKANRPDEAKQDNYTRGMSVLAQIPGIRQDQVNTLQRIVDSGLTRTDFDKAFHDRGDDYMLAELERLGMNDPVVRRYVRQAFNIALGTV